MNEVDRKHVMCMSCGKKYRAITQAHTSKCCNLTLPEYKEKYQNAETVCEEIKDVRKNNCRNLAKGIKKEKCIKCGKIVEVGKNIKWDVICDECRKPQTYPNQLYVKEIDKVVCQICWESFTMISNTHLENKHNMTIEKYKETYPNAPIINEEFIESKRKRMLEHNIADNPETREKIRKSLSTKYKDIEEKHSWLLDIEQFKDSPDGLMGRCKNHKCKNSKEKDGWFVLKKGQLAERIKSLKTGCGGNYFYCCEECKGECPLYRLNADNYIKNTTRVKKVLPYTHHEYKIFRNEVLNRQKEKVGENRCEICGSKIKLNVHHEHPQKTHPHMALDPDNGIVLCKQCHYKNGHKDDCAIHNISSLVCDNKYLNQKN